LDEDEFEVKAKVQNHESAYCAIAILVANSPISVQCA
jgi:hypothetical protein